MDNRVWTTQGWLSGPVSQRGLFSALAEVFSTHTEKELRARMARDFRPDSYRPSLFEIYPGVPF